MDLGGMMARTVAVARSSMRRSNLFLLAVIGAAFACTKQKAPDEVAQQGPSPSMTPMSGRSNGGAIANEAEDGQWVRPAKNYASTRFSGLRDITADNVKNLG